MGQTAKNIIFCGRVQGVGFRYTVCRIAAGYGLTGFVRNRPDGTVEAHMQGSEHQIDLCVTEIQDHFGRYIRGITATDLPVNPRYTDFQIVY